MPPRVFIRSLILLVITFSGILIYLFVFAPTGREYPSDQIIDLNEDNPYSALFIPDFTLVDREGNEFDDSYLDGKYTVVDFFLHELPADLPGHERGHA
jgi:cytochrome oxidase Cu insertion factor (SCO1/SenC/PrrC family)